MSDLKTQLRSYSEETSVPIDLDRMIASIAEHETTGSTRKLVRKWSRPVIAFAAALLVALVAIGLASLAMRGDSPDLIDEPVITTTTPSSPTVPLTEVEVTRIPSPAATSSVAVTESGEVWIGTDEALFRFIAGDWTRFESPHVLDLAIGTDGTVWAATPDGVIALDGLEWEASDQAPAYARELTITPDGSVWTGYGPGVHRWDGQKWEKIEDAIPKAVDQIQFDGYPPYLTSVGSSSDGTIWVGAWGHDQSMVGGVTRWDRVGGLTRFDGDNWEEIPLPGGEPTPVYNLAVAPNGNLWVVLVDFPPRTTGNWSLARFDGDDWTVFTEAVGMPQYLVSSMAIGHDGIVWLTQNETTGVGLLPHGVFAFDGNQWTQFLDGEHVWDIEVAPDGTIWLAGNDLYTIDRTSNP